MSCRTNITQHCASLWTIRDVVIYSLSDVDIGNWTCLATRHLTVPEIKPCGVIGIECLASLVSRESRCECLHTSVRAVETEKLAISFM